MSQIGKLANIDYRPAVPQNAKLPIGLIGCGGISVEHLTAYQNAGFEVCALADIDRSAAEQRRDSFFPDARIFEDYQELVADTEVAIVDIATHTAIRPPMVEAAIKAGKHVLSQKPFVLDLDEGDRLVELAEKHGVRLAVNQNGRWAPHFSFARTAVADGLLGALLSANLTVHWDHTWVAGTEFEKMHQLVLYDYAIHWFDIVSCLFGDRQAVSVYATAQKTATQTLAPPLLAQVIIQFEDGVATLGFNAETRYGPENRMFLSGSEGSIESRGPDEKNQVLHVTNQQGSFRPDLTGSWFPDGFQGTMAELICSIDQSRTPSIDARRNLRSLELCFAAVASADSGAPVRPGDVRRIST